MTPRLRNLERVYSTTSRQHLLELIEKQDTLLLRCADREIETFIKPVLERLSKMPSVAHIGDEGAWPFASPLDTAGFLDHFFWAKYEPNYELYWSDAFQGVIRQTCRAAVGKVEDWDTLQFDLFETCCGIEEDVVFFPSSIETWVVEALFERIHILLLNGDMDSVRDWGVLVNGNDIDVTFA